jgi:hypothetical protein
MAPLCMARLNAYDMKGALDEGPVEHSESGQRLRFGGVFAHAQPDTLRTCQNRRG